MHRLVPLQRLLDASSDRGNPTPEELDAFFHRARTIAVIGLSRDPSKTARRVPSYLAAKGYDVIPVNPNAHRILGKDAYGTLDDVEVELDAVIIFRPSEVAGPFVDAAARRPERPVIWLQEGIRADREIETARAAGIMAVQDLCSYRVHRIVYADPSMH